MRANSDKKLIQYGLVCLCTCLFLVSCQDPIGGPGQSPIFLTVQGKEPWGVFADVYDPTVPGNVTLDTTWVTFQSRYRDDSAFQPTTDFADVLIQEQRVTYFRYDGNPNVPDPFIVTVPSMIVPNGGTLDLEIPIVSADAKLQSPLKELAFGGGEGEIFLSAQVKFYGQDIAGNSVYGEIVVPVWAADY